MSKQDNSARGWNNGTQSQMSTNPSVGRFSSSQEPSLHTKGSSAKFSDNDRQKTLAPFSNYGQHSPEPSQQPAGADIVDLRTATSTEWKAMRPAKPNHPTRRHCTWYNRTEYINDDYVETVRR